MLLLPPRTFLLWTEQGWDDAEMRVGQLELATQGL